MPNPARLRELADAMQQSIDHAFNPHRLANTPKRAREAGAARIEGRRLERTQTALRRLADAHERRACPPILAGIGTKARAYDLLGSFVTHNGGYYDCGSDENRPRDQSPEALALWTLATEAAPADMDAERLRQKLDSLKFARIPGYFPTPAALCARMVDLAELPPRPFTVLEPSAGHGAIADAIKSAAPDRAKITVCEYNHTLREILTAKGYNLTAASDFLDIQTPEHYDRILMNPPFENNQDTKHTMHAFNFLKPGGILVSILSAAAPSRPTFRQWLDDTNAERYPIPAGAFRESGTDVASTLVLAVRPSAP